MSGNRVVRVFDAVTIAGLALVAVGVLVPSGMWIGLWRGDEPSTPQSVWLGASMFRVALIVAGGYAINAARLGWWDTIAIGGTPPSSPSRVEWITIGALVAAATALRFHRLGDGLWIDEILTLVESVRPPIGHIISTYPSQNHHILYSVLARLAFDVWGESSWALRLPAALFGIATIVAVWRFGRLVLGPREGLLAAAVLTCSYQHIWFSQNARGYVLLLFWAIVSSHFLVRGLREGSSWLWGAFAVGVTLGMYTHMTMIFVVAGQLGVCAALTAASSRSWRDTLWWRPLVAGFVPAGLATILLYAPLLPQIPAASAADRSDVAQWRSPLWLLQELGRGAQLGPLMWLVAACGLLVIGAALVSFARRKDFSVPILFALPTVLGAATMIAAGHHLWPRFFFFVVAFAILIAIEGGTEIVRRVGVLVRWSPTMATHVATAGVVLGIVGLGRTLPYVYGPKQDYSGARAFVEAERRSGDAVVTVGRSASAFRVYVAPEWGSVETGAGLATVRAAHARTWLVYTMPVEIENNYPDVLRVLKEEFDLVATFRGTLQGGDILVYRSRTPPAGVGAAQPGAES